MFSYYGAKTNVIKAYPKPVHGKIIEPFAGSARYALRYWEHEVLLVDKYEVIVKIWKWLQQCSSGDILKLPKALQVGQTLDDIQFDCQEAKSLMGFVIHFGAFSPGKKITPHYAIHRRNGINYSLQRIARNLNKIKHWDIRHGSYQDIKNEQATWFIDPPYQFGGHSYVESNRKIDYEHLSTWSRYRQGQIIICENSKATWMPFKRLSEHYTRTGIQEEMIWSNQELSFPKKQLELL